MNSTQATLKPPRTKATCAHAHQVWTRNPPGSVIMCWPCKQAGRRTRIMVPGTPPPAPPPLPHPGRRAWLLTRLLAADGPGYDDLCRGVVVAFGEDGPPEGPEAEPAAL